MNHFRHFFLGLAFLLLSGSFFPTLAQNLSPKAEFHKAEVLSITNESKERGDLVQTLKVSILDGKEKGKNVTTTFSLPQKNADGKLMPKDEVILEKTTVQKKTQYHVMDRYRLPPLLTIVLAFFAFVIFIAGKKGLGSILGMCISLAIILYFIVPQILHGADPLLISILGSLVIMATTIYLAHGITQRTTIALASTAISLLLTGLLAVLFVSITRLTGMGSEDAYALQFNNATINLQGLLLGGIIIGALGVLDDITTAQTATVFELARANEKLKVRELFDRGYNVGKEHIVSLVNTLVLAYAGASLAIFMLFVLNPLNMPYWVILNNEMIVEEIVRTLAGSIGLILAVPITTILAAFFARYSLKIK